LGALHKRGSRSARPASLGLARYGRTRRLACSHLRNINSRTSSWSNP
jgi:hypothetical protein